MDTVVLNKLPKLRHGIINNILDLIFTNIADFYTNPGYKVVRRDRNRNGGGVIIYQYMFKNTSPFWLEMTYFQIN